MPRDDLNFKLSLDAGVKHLQTGQLRKAEKEFRDAIKRCPECGAGYRGLAKVFVELDERPTALEALRQGAQVLARAGNRTEAIELLRDAVRLAPLDLAVHRRLAAALANAGDEGGAAAEHDRFITLALERGDEARARLELAYAREMLADASALGAVADRLGVETARVAAATVAEAPTGDGQPVAELPEEPRERALALEARAMRLLARRDRAGAEAALEAASALLEVGLHFAASDLLLLAVAAGGVRRDAQRLLAEVASGLGRGDLARQKRLLLAETLRLDGQVELAAELERLASL